ncbi:MAG: transposase [Bdellovibrionota bacterium]
MSWLWPTMLILAQKFRAEYGHIYWSSPALEFLEKLAALIPPPRIHLTRFHGILAPHSKYRKFVVPQIVEENNSDTEKSLEVEQSDANIGANRKRISWAKLSRVFALDATNCRMADKYDHFGRHQARCCGKNTHPPRPPLLAPPISESKFQRQGDFWDQTPHYDDSQII